MLLLKVVDKGLVARVVKGVATAQDDVVNMVGHGRVAGNPVVSFKQGVMPVVQIEIGIFAYVGKSACGIYISPGVSRLLFV